MSEACSAAELLGVLADKTCRLFKSATFMSAIKGIVEESSTLRMPGIENKLVYLTVQPHRRLMEALEKTAPLMEAEIQVIRPNAITSTERSYTARCCRLPTKPTPCRMQERYPEQSLDDFFGPDSIWSRGAPQDTTPCRPRDCRLTANSATNSAGTCRFRASPWRGSRSLTCKWHAHVRTE